MRRGSIAVALGLAFAVPASAGAAPPPIGHVFTIVLENKDFEESFGAEPKSEQLGKVLPAMGALLTQYHATGHLSLDNYIAMVSGQGPNPLTQSDCQTFAEFFPGTIGADGQAEGMGCVYPATVKTVADQLTAKGLTWGGYMEDMADSTTDSKTCRHPALNGIDDTQTAEAGDQYAARHNPFVYFHSIIDTMDCHERNVDLDLLQGDLLRAETTPNYTFITPDLCSDGHDEPCVDGRPGGFASIDAFLAEWVPRITASPAFKKDGLLIVTFDESEHGAEACCVTSAPNTPNAGGDTPGPGGGRIGAVLVSPWIVPGTRVDVPYNHYSYLRTVEDVFGLEPLGFAAKSAGFGDEVFTGPGPEKACASAQGRLIERVRWKGRRIRVRMAQAAGLRFKSRGRTFARRHGRACRTVRVRAPRAARRVRVTATAGDAREVRRVRRPRAGARGRAPAPPA